MRVFFGVTDVDLFFFVLSTTLQNKDSETNTSQTMPKIRRPANNEFAKIGKTSKTQGRINCFRCPPQRANPDVANFHIFFTSNAFKTSQILRRKHVKQLQTREKHELRKNEK